MKTDELPFLPEGAKKDKNGVWRDKLGRILPGQVNNPQGRKNLAQTEVVKLAKEMSEACIRKLFDIAMNGSEKGSLKACEVILDRAYGKPVSVTNPAEGGMFVPRPIIVANMDELRKIDEEITNSGETVQVDSDES